MEFGVLTITRLVVHRIHMRSNDRQEVQPQYGTRLVTLAQTAKDYLREQVIAALTSNSKCLEMTIAEPLTVGATASIAQQLLSSNDDLFIQNSRSLADSLTKVQFSRSIPGGMLLIFQGTVGGKKYLGILKAEVIEGFQTTDDDAIKLLEDLFLTKGTRLYKMGLFIQPMNDEAFPKGWKSFVFDTGIEGGDRQQAANYFYGSFLGCVFPQNAASQTKLFFQTTAEFVRTNFEGTERSDITSSLFTYLKVKNSNTVSPSEFAKDFLKPDIHDQYLDFLKAKNVPIAVIKKDLSEISFKRRRLRFGETVQLTAKPEDYDKLLEIKEIDGKDEASGKLEKWTQITVRTRIKSDDIDP
jgi:hypothetical protein